MCPKPSLSPSSVTLRSYGGGVIKHFGVLRTEVQLKDGNSVCNFFGLAVKRVFHSPATISVCFIGASTAGTTSVIAKIHLKQHISTTLCKVGVPELSSPDWHVCGLDSHQRSRIRLPPKTVGLTLGVYDLNWNPALKYRQFAHLSKMVLEKTNEKMIMSCRLMHRDLPIARAQVEAREERLEQFSSFQAIGFLCSTRNEVAIFSLRIHPDSFCI
ncbi:uncharacterized protein LOC142578394 [Dermacentor variabilis]|uniref:uncharacterized protein LOC142578394 n=1 Tax=Dermacentor variabilis TaxID=34621 RepID=UPI003F5B4162